MSPSFVLFSLFCMLLSVYIAITLEFSATGEVTHGVEDCSVVRGVYGAEDVLKWNEHVLVSNFDMFQTMIWYESVDGVHISRPGKGKRGEIYELVEENRFRVVTRNGFPEDFDFRPHGFGIYGDVLWVVNHAWEFDGLKAAERLDSFTIVERNGNVELDWIGVVSRVDGFVGQLNSIAPISEDSFYTTQWLRESRFPSVQGEHHNYPFDVGSDVLYLLNPFVKKSVMWYCKGYGKFEEQCKIVGPLGKLWNGIVSTKDLKRIVTVDLLAKEIHIFDIDAISLDLIPNRIIYIPHRCDNVRLSEDGSSVYVAGTTSLAACQLLWKPKIAGQYPLGDNGHKCPGHVTKINLDNYTSETLIIHDGSLLGGISVAIPINNEKILFGSYADDGILICPLK